MSNPPEQQMTSQPAFYSRFINDPVPTTANSRLQLSLQRQETMPSVDLSHLNTILTPIYRQLNVTPASTSAPTVIQSSSATTPSRIAESAQRLNQLDEDNQLVPPPPPQDEIASREQSSISSDIDERNAVEQQIRLAQFELQQEYELQMERAEREMQMQKYLYYCEKECRSNRSIEMFQQNFTFNNTDDIDQLLVCKLCTQVIFSFIRCEQCSQIMCSYCISHSKSERCCYCNYSNKNTTMSFWPADFLSRLGPSRVKCKHCCEIVKFESMGTHLSGCLTECPFACKVKVTRQNVGSHMKTCKNRLQTCSFRVYGCSFRGTTQELQSHEEIRCSFSAYEQMYKQWLRIARDIYSTKEYNRLFNANTIYVIQDPSSETRIKCSLHLTSQAEQRSELTSNASVGTNRSTPIETPRLTSAPAKRLTTRKDFDKTWSISMLHSPNVIVPKFEQTLPVPIPFNCMQLLVTDLYKTRSK